MHIPLKHQSLMIDDELFDLSHLDAFGCKIVGRGVTGGDIPVVIKFSTHVFSDRATHGKRRDLQDHGGTWRTFCSERYSVSLLLPAIMCRFVEDDSYTSISQ